MVLFELVLINNLPEFGENAELQWKLLIFHSNFRKLTFLVEECQESSLIAVDFNMVFVPSLLVEELLLIVVLNGWNHRDLFQIVFAPVYQLKLLMQLKFRIDELAHRFFR
jgi:hypothetical protein